MALGSALVDRARIVTAREAGVVVEGTTVFSEVPGPWFKARLTMDESPAQRAEAGVQRVVQKPKLLFAARNVDGDPVEMSVEDRVEVESGALGSFVFSVDGDPSPLRTKRRVIGWETTLRRVLEHERTVA